MRKTKDRTWHLAIRRALGILCELFLRAVETENRRHLGIQGAVVRKYFLF
jgi:hypothetical protein